MAFRKVRHNIRLLRDKMKGWAAPETLRLKPLFDMQDNLLEHKFPHEHTMVMDNIISNAGDIYREMTHAFPHYGYVFEKWERLTKWLSKPPSSLLQAGDWEEIRNQIHDPHYEDQRQEYLNNLQNLRDETTKLPMDTQRKAVMIESLDLIKALIRWFESLDPYTPPQQELNMLTAAMGRYFLP